MPHPHTETPPATAALTAYQHDYAQWVEDTARAIEEGRFDQIDRIALADEVRDLGKIERRELESALRVLLIHLLKTKYQPEKQTRSWEASIRVQRKHVAEVLDESPSLRPKLPKLIGKAYDQARIDAANETGLDIDTFPEACEWSAAEMLADPA
jgi:Domain of unknown function DUF29